MCTAITYLNHDFYFGRNLDLDYHYQESVVIMPRQFPLTFRQVAPLSRHYAMIGTAYVTEGIPLYYEATNEKGLSMAGLNFVGNAVYYPITPGKDNITPFEFIPWILGQCDCLQDARTLLERINLVDIPFSDQLPNSQLHWMIANREGALVVETTAEGMRVYDDPVGVLTNNPPFPYHRQNLANYMSLSNQPPVNRFCQTLKLEPYSRGMGAMGLPGDLSSASRFVRAAFTRLNSAAEATEAASITQFFHILSSVAMPRGAVEMPDHKYEVTVYSCCCNADTGVFYYSTYENPGLTAVDMHRVDLDAQTFYSYPMLRAQQVFEQN